MDNNNNLQQQLYQQQRTTKKYFALILILLMVIGLSIGYAIMTADLTITGSTKIKDDITWDVEPAGDDIRDSVECSDDVNCTFADSQDEFNNTDPAGGPVFWMDGKTIKFKHVLTDPGQKFSFDVTYTNNGSLDAVIDENGVVVPDNVDVDITGGTVNEMLTYDVSLNGGPILDDTKLLRSGDSHVFTVTVTLKEVNSDSEFADFNEAVNVINARNDGAGQVGTFSVHYVQA